MDTNWRGHWCSLRISSLLFAEDPGSEEREFPNQLTKAELKDSAKTQFVMTIKIDMITKQVDVQITSVTLTLQTSIWKINFKLRL